MPVPVPSWGINWTPKPKTAWCHCGWAGPLRDLRQVRPDLKQGCPKCNALAIVSRPSPRLNVRGWLWLLTHPKKR